MLVKQKLKYIQSLGQKKFRDEEGRFLAEGPKLVRELLQEKPSSIDHIYALPAWIDEVRPVVETTAVTATELERISQLHTPNQVVAVVKQFDHPLPGSIGDHWVLALDAIRDPGNMGTIIRIADWFGIGHIVCSADSADHYNPKVVQSTMGSIARVQVHYTALAQWLSQQKSRIYATSLDGEALHTLHSTIPGIIIIGNEGSGISEEVFRTATKRITIPRYGQAESLNAAVATGIVLGALVR